jgi:hypothetical protein
MSKKSFFSSWSYIIFAFVLYYGIARLVFSFQYIEPVHVMLDAAQCQVADVPINPQYGSCVATGRLTTLVTGDYAFWPSSRPGMELPMSKMPTYYHSDGADHFPGGTTCMSLALLLPALVLLLPLFLGLLSDIDSISQRIQSLRQRRG